MSYIHLNSNISRYAKQSFLIFLLIFLASCSLKTLYNNLDSLIPTYINRMVDLDDELSDLVDLRITTFLKWHRSDQLPRYTSWLERVKEIIVSDRIKTISQKEVLSIINQSSLFWLDIRAKTSPELARLLPLLNNEQIDELFENLTESNDDFIKKNISLSKNEKEQLYEERLVDFFEEWLGYLNDEQLAILHNSASKFKTLSNMRLKARLEWQRGTRTILISEDISNKAKKLELLFFTLSKKQDEQYKEINIENRIQLAKVTFNIFKTLHKNQQKNAIAKLNYYIKLIKSLINEN